MALTIDHFRQLKMPTAMSENDLRGLAKVKVEKSSVDGELKLKLFGIGKGYPGMKMRAEGGVFAKIYSFFHDPSGSANRSLRREFVNAFQNAYGDTGIDIRKHINPESKKPLNASQVIGLIASADIRKAELTKGETIENYKDIDVSHGNFADSDSLERAFKGFADKGQVGEQGSRMLDFASAFDREGLVIKLSAVEKRLQEIREQNEKPVYVKPRHFGGDDGDGHPVIPDEHRGKTYPDRQYKIGERQVTVPNNPITKSELAESLFPESSMEIEGRRVDVKPFDDLSMLCGTHWRLPVIETKDDAFAATACKPSLTKLYDFLPTGNSRDVILNTALRTLGVNLVEVAYQPGQLGKLAAKMTELMNAVKTGDANAVRETGAEILELTREIKGSVDGYLKVLEQPMIRDEFLKGYGYGGADSTPLQNSDAVSKYNDVLFAVQQMSKMINAKGSGFQSLIALGAVASGNPELAIERLGEKLPREDAVELPLLNLDEVVDMSGAEQRLTGEEIGEGGNDDLGGVGEQPGIVELPQQSLSNLVDVQIEEIGGNEVENRQN